MKTQIKHNEKLHDIDVFVTDIVTATDYDTRGIAETADEKAQNVGKAFGRLIKCMVTNGLLSEEQLIDIIGHYNVAARNTTLC